MKLLNEIFNNNLPPNNLIQIIRFVLVGSTTVFLDFAILFLLVHYDFTNYFIGAGISFTIASSINYLLSIKFVFLSGKFNRKSKEFSLFMILTFFGLMLNQLSMYLFVGVMGFFYIYAKLFSTVIVVVYNFSFKKFIVFIK